MAQLPASSPSSAAEAIEGVDEAAEAYKPFVDPMPLTEEQQAKNMQRLSQMVKQAIKSMPQTPHKPDEARLEKLNRMLQDPITRGAAIKIIMTNDDYEITYDEEGNPVSVDYVPF